MKEISELQAFQRNEIEHLYKELGKTLPPNVGLLHAAPPSGRRRRASKHKLKAGKLLNPMVQQLKNNLNTSSERKGMMKLVYLMMMFTGAQLQSVGALQDSQKKRRNV